MYTPFVPLIPSPSVHLSANLHSSNEHASGIASKSDAVDIAVLHRSQGPPTRDVYRVSLTATQGGLLLLSLRKVLDDGSTVLLYRQDEGREANESEADWGKLAPRPELPVKGRR